MTRAILLGPTRTGTTSLFRHFLDEPGIVCSRLKETNYFLPAVWGADKRFNEAEYQSLFPTEGQHTLEASPLYFCGGRKVARAIHGCFGDTKFIVVVRNPVDRFQSLYHHIGLKRDQTFQDSLASYFATCESYESSTVKGYQDLNWLGLKEGCYGQLLHEWLELFGIEQFHFIDFESLNTEPEAVLSGLYDFLGLVRGNDVETLTAHNQTRFVENRAIHGLAMVANDLLEPALNKLPGLRVLIRNIYYRLNGSEGAGEKEGEGAENSDAGTIHKLERYYQADRGRLCAVLNQDDAPLPAWLKES